MTAASTFLMHQHALPRLDDHIFDALMRSDDGLDALLPQILPQTPPHSTRDDHVASREPREYSRMTVVMSRRVIMSRGVSVPVRMSRDGVADVSLFLSCFFLGIHDKSEGSAKVLCDVGPVI